MSVQGEVSASRVRVKKGTWRRVAVVRTQQRSQRRVAAAAAQAALAAQRGARHAAAARLLEAGQEEAQVQVALRCIGGKGREERGSQRWGAQPGLAVPEPWE